MTKIRNFELKNRLDLAKYFATLGYKTGAEIGVRYGRYSQILCESIPNLKLYCIDKWPHKDSFAITKRTLSPYNSVIIKKSSMDALNDFADESLDFVFIDAAHDYKSVKEDIEGWTKKVRVGGMVSGDDYYVFPNSKNRGVIDAVDEYINKHDYKLLTTPLDYTVAGKDDRQPCWYFTRDK